MDGQVVQQRKVFALSALRVEKSTIRISATKSKLWGYSDKPEN